MTAELELRTRYANRMLAFQREGIHEVPDGSNRQRLGAHFGWNGVAWCCITCCEAFFEEFGFYLFKTAGVAQAIGWAKAGTYGLRWIPRERAGEALVADLGTYDSGRLTNPGNPAHFHINMVTDKATIANGPSGFFKGTGGNESNAVRTSDRDGKYLQGFIVLPWREIADRLGIPWGSPTPTVPDEEEDMPGAFTVVCPPNESTYVPLPTLGFFAGQQVFVSFAVDFSETAEIVIGSPGNWRTITTDKKPIEAGRKLGVFAKRGDELVVVHHRGKSQRPAGPAAITAMVEWAKAS